MRQTRRIITGTGVTYTVTTGRLESQRDAVDKRTGRVAETIVEGVERRDPKAPAQPSYPRAFPRDPRQNPISRPPSQP